MDDLAKLQRTLSWAQGDYRNTKIASLSEFANLPPMTAEYVRAHAHSLSSLPPDKLYSLYATGGTTGIPKLIYYSEEALEAVATATSEGMAKIFPDMRGELAILIVPSDNLAAVGEYTKRALRNLGAHSASMGLTYTPAQSAQLARVMSITRPKLLIGNPARLTKLTSELKDNNVDPRSIGISFILSTSEVLTNKTRAMLVDAYGAKVYQGGGMSEVGWSTMEGPSSDGQHILTNVYAEVIDPGSGEPITEGVGELYLTTLVNPAFPLVRYKTEDLVRITQATQDGMEGPRIWYKCRLSESINIGNTPLYAYEIDEALELTPEVQAAFSLSLSDGKLTLSVESEFQTDSIQQKVRDAIASIPVLANWQVIVQLVPPETLERSPRGKVKNRMITI